MAQQDARKSGDKDALFRAILALQTPEECRVFFEDLCTMKEVEDMAQRLTAARLLLEGCTYEQIVRHVAISTATISRINRCIQYGQGGYRTILERVKEQQEAAGEEKTTEE
ncbi:MAG: TrpR-related protein YerC/YecD [Subdoligranulum sp.]|nr:TrpR-related protein YerC/YecD [Subdoligranulum sp.]